MGRAVGSTRKEKLHPPVYSLSWVFESSGARLYCSHSLLPNVTEARLVRSVSGTLFDAKMARVWLEECNSSHDCIRAPSSDRSWNGSGTGLGFRVIDVKKNCVVEAPQQCQYVALSYVWGNVQQPLLTRETVAFYATHGSLSTLNLPQTIKDAMRICRTLYLRYLWVDSLCKSS